MWVQAKEKAQVSDHASQTYKAVYVNKKNDLKNKRTYKKMAIFTPFSLKYETALIPALPNH